MAELKRNFGKGLMDKDSDERIVNDGTFRDANNIQVSSSDGADVGSVQTLLGNTEVTPNVVLADYSTCVGVYDLPEKDVIYYFVSSGGHPGQRDYQPLIYKDYIIEYDTNTQLSKYIVVDIFKVKNNARINIQSGAPITTKYFEIASGASATINKTGVRCGMLVTGTFTNNSGSSRTIAGMTVANGATYYISADHAVEVVDIVKDPGGNGWRIFTSTALYMNANEAIVFVADRVLNLNPFHKITAIDHIDGLLFWSDNLDEPKKINIERSRLGTGGVARVNGWNNTLIRTHATNVNNSNNLTTFLATNNSDFHTRLVITRASTGYEVAQQRNEYEPMYLTKDHITVIRKYPKSQLKLSLSDAPVERTPIDTNGNSLTPNATAGSLSAPVLWRDSSGDPYESGQTVSGLSFTTPVDLRIGDIVIFTNDTTIDPSALDSTDALVRATITDAPGGAPQNGGSTGPYTVDVDSVSTLVNTIAEDYVGRLETENALFEFKFPRFSYRYRYVDGEYSVFAPWTEVAFMPGAFDYIAKKGTNLGMTNRLKSLKLSNYFLEFDLVPNDIVAIDLLYKEETSPNIYTVKTLTRENEHPEWPDRAGSNKNRGEYLLTSEMIHAVVPSNQILRPWDNVPKKAAALAITGNRLVFANYKQGYDINGDVNLDVALKSIKGENYLQDGGIGERSVKTMRTYQLGVVYGDEYGRETPVQAPKKSSSISVDKKYSIKNNKLGVRANFGGTTIPTWASYMKYYVKETSNQYYNMVMDRWYDAEDGNVWISFPSSERNKIDIDTHLILKKRHDNTSPVLEKARYKVLAIENNAPDYIKSKKVSHGSATTNTTPTNTTVNYVVTSNTFTNAFGAQFMEQTWAKVSSGYAYARLVGTVSGGAVATTDWKELVSLKQLAVGSLGDYSFRISSAFENADMSSLLTGTITYQIELREDVIHNRPEFDGRFFVKLYKDLLLQNSIMVDLDPTASLTLIDTFPLRLLIGAQGNNEGGSTATHPSTTGPFSSYSWDQDAHGGNGINCIACPDESFGMKKSKGRLQDWWHAFTSSTNSGSAGQDKIYMDGIEWYRYNWRSSGHVNHNEANGVNDTHLGGIGDGDGVLKHYSSYSKMYLGFPFWRDNHGPADNTQAGMVRRFFETMRTPGTIFRFRDDTTQTAYRVIAAGGVQQSWNYNKSSTNSNPHGEVQSKSTAFNINFERLDGGGPMDPNAFDVLSLMRHDGSSITQLDILQQDFISESGGSDVATENPAIWETEPKEDVGLDIYYEASSCFPLNVDRTNNELLIPIGSCFYAKNASGTTHKGTSTSPVDNTATDVLYKITAVNSTNNKDLTSITVYNTVDGSFGLTDTIAHDSFIYIDRFDGSQIVLYVGRVGGGNFVATDTAITLVTGNFPTNTLGGLQPWRAPHFMPMKLGWSNCFQFGNGIESDRIRDAFNQSQITNGVKASTVLAERYAEEHRSSGFIFSGVFNSISGVNDLNQFIQAEPITKDLNPSYGSIQKLIARNTNTLAFCEDKILSIQTNKDALFNADGSSNVLSSTVVLGSATPIQGEYGISTNPESVAATSSAIYWCDQARSQVLKLTGGSAIQVISDIGMKDYFNDNLVNLSHVVGSYDDKKDEYNLTSCTKIAPGQLRPTTLTVSWNDKSKGWSSFKGFDGLELGVSLNNEYYTFKHGSMWKHHTNVIANNFYGTQKYSDVTLIFNNNPSSVKSFGSLNYEGTQSRITPFTTTTVNGVSYTDKEFYNLDAKNGWFVETMVTDLQDASNLEFKDKEGKWFSTIKGTSTNQANLDQKEFSVQGLGMATTSNTGATAKTFLLTVKNNNTSSSGTNWDTTADSTSYRVLDGPTVLMTEGQPTGAANIYNMISNQTLNSRNTLQYSGFNLDASEFIIPGGVATTTGSGNSTVYIYTAATGWNADPEVAKVTFINLGIAGDPGNIVQANIFTNSFTMPSAAKFIYVDIDLASPTVSLLSPPLSNRTSLFRVSYIDEPTVGGEGGGNPDHIVVSNSSVANMTKTSDNGYTGSTNASYLTDVHTGIVVDGTTSLVAKYTITADAGFELQPIAGSNQGAEVMWNPITVNIPYSSNYSWTVTNNNYTSPSSLTNSIQSCDIEIFYTPPTTPDPSDFNALLHDIRFTTEAVAVDSALARITSIGYLSSVFVGGTQVIPVTTNSVGNYRLQLGKLNTAGTAITGTYNFSTSAWDFSNTTHVGALSVTSADLNQAPIHQDTISVIMDTNATNSAGTYTIIALPGNVGSNDLALQSNIPDALGEATFSVLQDTGTLTFTGGTETSDNNTVITAGSTTIPSAKELTQLSATNVKTYTVEFTYTRQAGGLNKITKAGQNMIDGAGGVYKIGVDSASGQSTVTLTRVTGIKVGMEIKSGAGNGFIPDGTFVTSVNTTTKVVGLSQATTGIAPQHSQFEVLSDYSYIFTESSTVVNEAGTIATVIGVIAITSYGRKGSSSVPNGNITLKPNFLTVT